MGVGGRGGGGGTITTLSWREESLRLFMYELFALCAS